MTPTDYQPLLERLIGLSEVFRVPLSPAAQALYVEALQDLALPPVLAALGTLVRTARWFPKPAEIRQLVEGDVEARVEQAWLTWRTAARRLGSYRTVVTDDPVLAETLTAVFGGWVQACGAEYSPEMWASKRKEFGRVYQVLAARGLTGPRQLPGLAPGRPVPLEAPTRPALLEA